MNWWQRFWRWWCEATHQWVIPQRDVDGAVGPPNEIVFVCATCGRVRR